MNEATAEATDRDLAASAVVLTVAQVARSPLYLLLTETLVVGRDCDGLMLADPQTSRRHAEFRLIDGRVTVRDLDSANGTTLDGRPVTSETFSDAGSTVVVGTTRIKVGRPSDLRGASLLEPADDRPKSSIMLLSESLDAVPAIEDMAVSARQMGTFTIVFSDIEGSTAYATSVGDDAWMVILDRHEELIRRVVKEHGGRVVKNQGDGFMLTFESARRAVSFAIATQRQLDAERESDPSWDVRVRIGIHAGEAIATSDGDLFGRHVMVASRVADQADGNEIVASAIVRELAAGSIDFEFDDGLAVQLKGIGEQVVHRVAWRDPSRSVSDTQRDADRKP